MWHSLKDSWNLRRMQCLMSTDGSAKLLLSTKQEDPHPPTILLKYWWSMERGVAKLGSSHLIMVGGLGKYFYPLTPPHDDKKLHPRPDGACTENIYQFLKFSIFTPKKHQNPQQLSKQLCTCLKVSSRLVESCRVFILDLGTIQKYQQTCQMSLIQNATGYKIHC